MQHSCNSDSSVIMQIRLHILLLQFLGVSCNCKAQLQRDLAFRKTPFKR